MNVGSVKCLLSGTWWWIDGIAREGASGTTHPMAAQVAGELVDKAVQMLQEYQERVSPSKQGVVAARHDPEEARSVRHAVAALLHGAAAVLERT